MRLTGALYEKLFNHGYINRPHRYNSIGYAPRQRKLEYSPAFPPLLRETYTIRGDQGRSAAIIRLWKRPRGSDAAASRSRSRSIIIYRRAAARRGIPFSASRNFRARARAPRNLHSLSCAARLAVLLASFDWKTARGKGGELLIVHTKNSNIPATCLWRRSGARYDLSCAHRGLESIGGSWKLPWIIGAAAPRIKTYYAKCRLRALSYL